MDELKLFRDISVYEETLNMQLMFAETTHIWTLLSNPIICPGTRTIFLIQ
jgi:hypothetical protein